MCKRCVHKATETEFAVKVRKHLVNARNAAETALPAWAAVGSLDFFVGLFLVAGCCLGLFLFCKMAGFMISFIFFHTSISPRRIPQWKKPLLSCMEILLITSAMLLAN